MSEQSSHFLPLDSIPYMNQVIVICSEYKATCKQTTVVYCAGSRPQTVQHFRRCKNGAAVQHFRRCKNGAAVQHFKRCKNGAAVQHFKRCKNGAAVQHFKRCKNGAAVQHFKRCKMQEVQSGAGWNFLIQAVQEVLRFFFWVVLWFFLGGVRFFLGGASIFFFWNFPIFLKL